MNYKIKIKTGDTVKILSGKDAKKTGKVSQVLAKEGRVVVDGVNKMIRHLKAQKKGEKGQRVDFFGPLSVANVALLCPKCNKPTRIGYYLAKGEDGTNKKSRQCKKCKETFA
ncbi:MAG: 50S ribosomal protein L24 [Candidatus Kerfeldbacteria bacterium RIFOXYA2_FULL_38_24]|uniref:Large ribosomal subunit protein uL24 n=1 Tax=Candidatus Kerfeldbacteria bacterium RIFOXYB2_FULL_38_14 TaxID=1798547 RepID=A0A1G2BGC9_9BACT|nr:MAG: 50S ribosomal protein L24 [Candidatus Kerfeldbacteria bacterium RIFOXYB2_FULL_38_14]OGY87936.1 MAG: 50S ribosomal protein L24 [Candidatus Kerfeldbacteria bacterium RIFOXYA2_FULL_38_24]OGY88652.1 MAG: 50S ribosomal protein L24 [Candidatus Kerfeldbacteria bacterium RIFOXYC2_FULL_38_9]